MKERKRKKEKCSENSTKRKWQLRRGHASGVASLTGSRAAERRRSTVFTARHGAGARGPEGVKRRENMKESIRQGDKQEGKLMREEAENGEKEEAFLS